MSRAHSSSAGWLARGAGSRGFTLIELLVVIAIITVLISILLPTLTLARESGRRVRCVSNLRQLVLSAHVYAGDFKEKIWPSERCWRDDTDPRGMGVIFRYVDGADFVTECPANARRGARATGAVTNMFNQLGRALDFDYTFLDGFQGASLGLEIETVYAPLGVRVYQQELARSFVQSNSFKSFPSLPLLFEESTYFYNEAYPDGYFRASDQVSQRHDRGGNIGYLDGTVALFKPYDNGSESTVHFRDFKATNIYVGKHNSNTFYLPDNDGGHRYYGWVNAPHHTEPVIVDEP